MNQNQNQVIFDNIIETETITKHYFRRFEIPQYAFITYEKAYYYDRHRFIPEIEQRNGIIKSRDIDCLEIVDQYGNTDKITIEDIERKEVRILGISENVVGEVLKE